MVNKYLLCDRTYATMSFVAVSCRRRGKKLTLEWKSCDKRQTPVLRAHPVLLGADVLGFLPASSSVRRSRSSLQVRRPLVKVSEATGSHVVSYERNKAALASLRFSKSAWWPAFDG